MRTMSAKSRSELKPANETYRRRHQCPALGVWARSSPRPRSGASKTPGLRSATHRETIDPPFGRLSASDTSDRSSVDLYTLGPVAFAGTVNTIANPIDGCSGNTALYDPGEGQDIVVPDGYTVSVFAKGLNFPTGIAFRSTNKVDNLGNPVRAFEVFVLESGHGLPSRCNEQGSFSGPSSQNPFTPDVLVFDQAGNKLRGPLGKPQPTDTEQSGVLQPAGPAVDLGLRMESMADGCSSPTPIRQLTPPGRTTARVSWS
jgi:hypothetical protein